MLCQAGFALECYRKDYEPPPEAAPEEPARYLGTYADPMSGKAFPVIVRHVTEDDTTGRWSRSSSRSTPRSTRPCSRCPAPSGRREVTPGSAGARKLR
ncbi:MAG: hypothetical protein HOP15_15180 [Planctomycetes bacterium]|nr:hypothetical protein [Planctomycetota bacterium]